MRECQEAKNAIAYAFVNAVAYAYYAVVGLALFSISFQQNFSVMFINEPFLFSAYLNTRGIIFIFGNCSCTTE